jgi:hypothetical protein
VVHHTGTHKPTGLPCDRGGARVGKPIEQTKEHAVCRWMAWLVQPQQVDERSSYMSADVAAVPRLHPERPSTPAGRLSATSR